MPGVRKKKETGNCWMHSQTTSKAEAEAAKVLPRRQSNAVGSAVEVVCCKLVLQPVVQPFGV